MDYNNRIFDSKIKSTFTCFAAVLLKCTFFNSSRIIQAFYNVVFGSQPYMQRPSRRTGALPATWFPTVRFPQLRVAISLPYLCMRSQCLILWCVVALTSVIGWIRHQLFVVDIPRAKRGFDWN
jgi:hypothetical protein